MKKVNVFGQEFEVDAEGNVHADGPCSPFALDEARLAGAHEHMLNPAGLTKTQRKHFERVRRYDSDHVGIRAS